MLCHRDAAVHESAKLDLLVVCSSPLVVFKIVVVVVVATAAAATVVHMSEKDLSVFIRSNLQSHARRKDRRRSTPAVPGSGWLIVASKRGTCF